MSKTTITPLRHNIKATMAPRKQSSWRLSRLSFSKRNRKAGSNKSEQVAGLDNINVSCTSRGVDFLSCVASVCSRHPIPDIESHTQLQKDHQWIDSIATLEQIHSKQSFHYTIILFIVPVGAVFALRFIKSRKTPTGGENVLFFFFLQQNSSKLCVAAL